MKLLYLFVFAIFTLFFFGGPSSHSSQLIRLVWDAGHILFFCVLSILVFYHLKSRAVVKGEFVPIKSFFSVSLLGVLLGVIIEIVQHYVGRSFSLKDILYDAIGIYLGLVVFLAFDVGKYRWKKVNVFLGLAIFFLALSPVVLAAIDKVEMMSDFPILAGFERQYELNRWEANSARLSREESVVSRGEYSLAIQLSPEKYPGISLVELQENWLGYDQLRFSIFNDDSIDSITLKIYDKLHRETNLEHHDRFNRKIMLSKGWNHIEILLEDVMSAPQGRTTNMAEIVNVSLFVIDLEKPVTLYLDSLHLVDSR